jgi:hypothetical protein
VLKQQVLEDDPEQESCGLEHVSGVPAMAKGRMAASAAPVL